MPNRPCSEAGCGQLATYRGKCLTHSRLRERTTKRSVSRGFYQTKRWRVTRRQKLFITPLCERCGHVATDVHHKHGAENGNPFDLTTLESLCHRCHSRITRFQQLTGRGEGPVAA